jgi:glycosyltransferase involved in cell wall biosynthesis
MRIAVIVHRYGADLAGGAEHQARGFAEAAARRGWTIEVWTTCALSHYAWKNVYPAGEEVIDGVLVRRFPITAWHHDKRAQLEFRLDILGTLPLADQYAWLETGAHSAPLYQHIVRHANEFDALIVLPYAMPLAHYAAWSAPEQTVLWPCLHNEAYAYLETIHLLLESVWGVMFNSPEERDLAVKVLEIQPQRYVVLGEGVAVTPRVDAPQADSQCALLYVGRLEHGKNVHLLYQYVQQYFDEGGTIRLVVLGNGPVEPPVHPAFDYRGFAAEKEKAAACASALALCQPSINESFSLTIMESWMNGRPVLVNGDCAVTQGHVRRCDGGLEFRDYDEFVGAVEWLQNHPDLANRMGRNGREYVQRNYTWQAVLGRFERIMATWQSTVGTAEGART